MRQPRRCGQPVPRSGRPVSRARPARAQARRDRHGGTLARTARPPGRDDPSTCARRSAASPAVSASRSPSPARCSAIQRLSSSTSRPRPWESADRAGTRTDQAPARGRARRRGDQPQPRERLRRGGPHLRAATRARGRHLRHRDEREGGDRHGHHRRQTRRAGRDRHAQPSEASNRPSVIAGQDSFSSPRPQRRRGWGDCAKRRFWSWPRWRWGQRGAPQPVPLEG